MTGPSPGGLLREAARLAYHLHWPLDDILDLEHRDRRLFLEEAEGMAVETAGLAPAWDAVPVAWEAEPVEWSGPGEGWE